MLIWTILERIEVGDEKKAKKKEKLAENFI